MRMLGMDMCGMLVDGPSGKQGTHTWQLHNNPWLALDHLKRRLLYDGSITIASDPMTLFNVSPLDYVFVVRWSRHNQVALYIGHSERSCRQS
jgi:hypothetical protein